MRFDQREMDILIRDIKEMNGPLDNEKMSRCLKYGLMRLNCELDDIVLLMCLLRRWDESVDLEVRTFKFHCETMMNVIMKAKEDVRVHNCNPRWEPCPLDENDLDEDWL